MKGKKKKLVRENDIEIFTDTEAKVGAFNEHSMNYSANRSIVTKLFLRRIISSVYTRKYLYRGQMGASLSFKNRTKFSGEIQFQYAK